MKFIKRSRGLTMIEMLATVGMVGILGSISIALVIGSQESVKDQRLAADIESLNRSVMAYQANGGTLANNLTAQQVISKLKTVGDAETQQVKPGYRGAFIDGRLIAYNVNASETGPRAVWDPLNFQFSMTSGVDGVLFKMLDSATADAGVEESRGNAGPGFAKTSNWVWDFTDTPAPTTSTYTPVGTSDHDPTQTPGYLTPIQLGAPIFSIPGGTFPTEDFPLSLTLTNPPSNPANTPIRYSIDSTPWQLYDGTPLVVTEDMVVVAYADSNDSQIYSSYTTSELYRVGDSPPQTFAGQTSGEFLNAQGGEEMVAIYVQEGLNGTFEWGEGADGFDSGSQLSFYASEFLDVEAESWFRLGGLDYFNSTIWEGTQAINVELNLAIEFSTPNVMENFNFNFALENTANLEGNTANQNADFVRITNSSSPFSTELNGQQYELQLQFGYLGSDGFATVDEFHVHEGSNATADIWGYFVPTPDEDN